MPKDTTITISGGGQSVTMKEDEFFAVAKPMAEADRKRTGRPPVKNTPEDKQVSDQAYSVAVTQKVVCLIKQGKTYKQALGMG